MCCVCLDKPTDDARRRGALESRDGGKHGAPQERNMIEEILELERPKGAIATSIQCEAIPHRRSQNLAQARKRVKANKGAPGIDGMTVGDFPAYAREYWPRISTAIREGNYRPASVHRVFIPKPDGTQCP